MAEPAASACAAAFSMHQVVRLRMVNPLMIDVDGFFGYVGSGLGWVEGLGRGKKKSWENRPMLAIYLEKGLGKGLA